MKICARPLGGLLAQKEEPVKICKEGHSLTFCLWGRELGKHVIQSVKPARRVLH